MLENLKWLLALPLIGWAYQHWQDRRARDKTVFKHLDPFLSETQLIDFLDELAGGGFDRKWVYAVERYLDEATRTEHDYLNARIRDQHGLYLRSLRELLRFLGPRVLPASGAPLDRYQFLPDKNIDIRGDFEDMEEFDKEFKDLLDLAERTENHFRRYRRLITEKLHV